MRRLLTTIAVVSTLVAGPALAGSVYLNGVNIDGLTSQKFEKATVRIDEKGNVLIDAPSYKVEVQSMPSAPPQAPGPQAQLSTVPASGAPVTMPITAVGQPNSATPAPAVATLPAPAPTPAPPAAPRITQRYWLVTEQNAPGMTQYDIDMYINSRWVRRLRGDDDQVIAEVTSLLTPGKNTVLLRAHKAEGVRKSYSPSQYFRVILGTGNVGGAQVLIDQPLVSFERTAAQTEDASQEFTFVTQ